MALVGSGVRDTYDQLREIRPGYHALRTAYWAYAYLVDVSSHMATVRLRSGKFLVLGATALTARTKRQLDELTEVGSLIEAIVATHPRHTSHFRSLQAAYPDAPFYGTPLHLATLRDLKWAGCSYDHEVLQKWAPEVEMRVTDGAEADSRLAGVTVFHRSSGVVFCDDVIGVCRNPGLLMRALFGAEDGTLTIHPALHGPSLLFGPGLLHTADAPWRLRGFLQGLLRDWEFDTIDSAHAGEVVGQAKPRLRQALKRWDLLLETTARLRAPAAETRDAAAWRQRWEAGGRE